MIRSNNKSLSKQVLAKSKKPLQKAKKYDGNDSVIISTGSTLLDLAISGGRKHGGGLMSGIMVEVFGPNSAGKTVLLCEIAGGIQRQGGEVRFDDPEARLNKQFARIFDLNTDTINYKKPDTVTEVFSNIRKWTPKDTTKVNGTFTDSLAALSTKLEMGDEEGDKMGMRRAKEFSEGLRKNARILQQNNYLMVCSNQIRSSNNSYGPTTESPGGKAIGFYASLRLKADSPEKIWLKKNYKGKEVKKVIGVKTTFEVFKSSIWKPYRTAPVYIIFDYGIDDIRANLQYIKDYSSHKFYSINGESVGTSMEEAIQKVEDNQLELELKEEVIALWEDIETRFSKNKDRQHKRR